MKRALETDLVKSTHADNVQVTDIRVSGANVEVSFVAHRASASSSSSSLGDAMTSQLKAASQPSDLLPATIELYKASGGAESDVSLAAALVTEAPRAAAADQNSDGSNATVLAAALAAVGGLALCGVLTAFFIYRRKKADEANRQRRLRPSVFGGNGAAQFAPDDVADLVLPTADVSGAPALGQNFEDDDNDVPLPSPPVPKQDHADDDDDDGNVADERGAAFDFNDSLPTLAQASNQNDVTVSGIQWELEADEDGEELAAAQFGEVGGDEPGITFDDQHLDEFGDDSGAASTADISEAGMPSASHSPVPMPADDQHDDEIAASAMPPPPNANLLDAFEQEPNDEDNEGVDEESDLPLPPPPALPQQEAQGETFDDSFNDSFNSSTSSI